MFHDRKNNCDVALYPDGCYLNDLMNAFYGNMTDGNSNDNSSPICKYNRKSDIRKFRFFNLLPCQLTYVSTSSLQLQQLHYRHLQPSHCRHLTPVITIKATEIKAMISGHVCGSERTGNGILICVSLTHYRIAQFHVRHVVRMMNFIRLRLMEKRETVVGYLQHLCHLLTTVDCI